MGNQNKLFHWSWCIRGIVLGAFIGPVITFLTNLVTFATDLRTAYPYLLLTIPFVALLQQYIRCQGGTMVENSAALIIDSINDSSKYAQWCNDSNSFLDDRGIPPTILGPLLLLNTFLTHISGGSGGKEGAGVMLGTSIAGMTARAESKIFHTNYSIKLREAYLMCGAGAAFSALFSAPLAGCMFGLLFANPRINRNETFLPYFTASITAYLSSNALHIHHLPVAAPLSIPFTSVLLIKIIIAAVCIGLFGRFFCFVTDITRDFYQNICKNKMRATFFAGCTLLVVTGVFYVIVGEPLYNGLSTPLIKEAGMGETSYYAAIFKLILTTLTVAACMTGGEIVPLLVIGATLGATLAPIFGLPPSSMACFGAVGILSSGSKMPVVCFLLGLELFGTSDLVYLFAVTVISFSVSGNRRIFQSQIAPV